MSLGLSLLNEACKVHARGTLDLLVASCLTETLHEPVHPASQGPIS